jgi:F-type H+-transporting ATPase subunit c
MTSIKVRALLLALIVFATPIFAQTGAVAPSDPWTKAAAALAMGIASAGCGIAQSKAVAGCAEGMARNPGASAGIRFALILGLALIESLALYTLVVVFRVA